jgi:hypothetical protein
MFRAEPSTRNGQSLRRQCSEFTSVRFRVGVQHGGRRWSDPVASDPKPTWGRWFNDVCLNSPTALLVC